MTLLLLVDLFGSVVAVPSAFRAQLVDAVANGGDASTIVTCVSGTPCWLDITFQESFRFWVELPYQFKVFVEAKTALAKKAKRLKFECVRSIPTPGCPHEAFLNGWTGCYLG